MFACNLKLIYALNYITLDIKDTDKSTNYLLEHPIKDSLYQMTNSSIFVNFPLTLYVPNQNVAYYSTVQCST